MTDQSHEEVIEWYCRRSGHIIGPLIAAQLEELIASGSLEDHDLVRPGMEREWLPLGIVRSVLQEEAPPDAPNAAEAAAQLLSRAASERQSAPNDRDRLLQPWLQRERRGDGLLDGAASLLDTAFGGVGRLLAKAAPAFRYRIVQIGVGGALVILFAGFIMWQIVLPRLPVKPDEVLAEYQSLWHAIQHARDGKADPGEWDRLEERVGSTVAGTRQRVRREAGSRRPELQDLMWAAEELPRALDAARKGADDASGAPAKLIIHLQDAERNIARRAELAATQPRNSEPKNSDLLFWGMIGFDALLVLVGIVYLVRNQWWHRNSRHAVAR